MWVPTHYACLIIAILLLESAALFAYTLIGLLKSNPLPWIMQPPMSQYGMCQTGPTTPQTLRGGPVGDVQQQDTSEQLLHVVTSTSVVYQTIGVPTKAPDSSVALGIAANIKGGAAAAAVDSPRTITEKDGRVTTITPPSPASIDSSTTSSASSTSTPVPKNDDKPNPENSKDKENDGNGTKPGTPTTLSGRDTTDTQSSTKTKSVHFVTSVTFLTSTLAPPKDQKPQSTSTTVVMVAAEGAIGKRRR